MSRVRWAALVSGAWSCVFRLAVTLSWLRRMRQSLLVTPAVNRPVEDSTICLLSGKENTGREEILFIYIRKKFENKIWDSLFFSFFVLLCICTWFPTGSQQKLHMGMLIWWQSDNTCICWRYVSLGKLTTTVTARLNNVVYYTRAIKLRALTVDYVVSMCSVW